MIDVLAHMQDLARLLNTRVPRPVTADPSRLSPPCVLVEPPSLQSSGTLCGEYLLTHTVIVIGMPGAALELAPLALLLGQVLDALDELPFGVTNAEPVSYLPFVPDGQADPCQAYRLTIEEYP